MKFTLSQPHTDMDIACWKSEQGKWEIGFRQMLFGVRVSLTRIGDEWYTLDYCAADQPGFAWLLLATVVKILERYPEDVNPNQLQRDFPGYEIKPINKDPYCWQRLQQMAELETVGGDRA